MSELLPGLQVLSFGHFHPDNVISNEFLESLDIGTSDEWIMERVGIRTRRTTMPLDYIASTRNKDPRAAEEAADYSLTETGVRAARMAIARAGINVQDIGMVLAGSSSMDNCTPVEAAFIARDLELEVPVMDINSACTSFFANLHMVAMMRPEALPDYILVVTPESGTRTVDYDDRSSAVLWGDAAAAAVVSTRHRGKAVLTNSVLESSPASADRIRVPRFGHFSQQGGAVQMFAVKKTVSQIKRLRKESDQTRPLQFVGHQANLRMLQTVCGHAGVSEDQHFFNVDEFGNTAASSAISVISQRWDNWRADDQLAVVGVGAGLTWGGYLLDFANSASLEMAS